MKKADMEFHRAQYQGLMVEARAAEREGRYRLALEQAVSAWEHIDGMMQYERKYDDAEFQSVAAIEMSLRYAPFLLDFKTLDNLDSLLKDCRRIERNTSEALKDKLGQARARMWENHQLWDYLEKNPGTRQDHLRRILGGDQDQWRSTVERWERMCLLRRIPDGESYRLALATRMDEVILTKCPSCGEVVEGPKAMFLEDIVCPECETSVVFVILTVTPTSEAKE